jgi:hypothetical protein
MVKKAANAPRWRKILFDIEDQLALRPEVTRSGILELCADHPAFVQAYKLDADINVRESSTFTHLFLRGRSSGRQNESVVATRVQVLLKKFDLIDLPDLEQGNYFKWFDEIRTRLLAGGRRDLRYVGGPNEAIRKVGELIAELKQDSTDIYNTVFTRTPDEAQSIRKVIDEFELTKFGLVSAGNCTWCDIVLAGDELTEYLENFKGRYSDQTHKPRFKVLDVHLPLFQGLVIKRGDNSFAALVGWMFLGSSQVRVYFSNHRETVDYFYTYMKGLYDSAEALDDYELRKRKSTQAE